MKKKIYKLNYILFIVSLEGEDILIIRNFLLKMPKQKMRQHKIHKNKDNFFLFWVFREGTESGGGIGPIGEADGEYGSHGAVLGCH